MESITCWTLKPEYVTSLVVFLNRLVLFSTVFFSGIHCTENFNVLPDKKYNLIVAL